jgi:hypothetical protein
MPIPYLVAGASEPPTTTNNVFFNGTSFNSNTNLNLSNIYGSAYNGTVWVLGGVQGTDYIYYSTDGNNWTPATSATPFFTNVYGVYWVGTKFIALGANYNVTGPNFGAMAYSTDGINWNTTGYIKNSSESNDGFIAISYNGSVYVATCYAGTGLYYSTDSYTWTKTGTGIFDDWGYPVVLSVTTDGSKFSVVTTFSSNSMAYSLDGITWVSLGAPIVVSFWNAGITYGNGLWMAVAGGGVGSNGFATSTDGITWSVSNTAPYLLSGKNGGAFCVHYDGTRFLIGSGQAWNDVTRNSIIYATTDGVNFTEVTFSQMPTTVYTITSSYIGSSGGDDSGGGSTQTAPAKPMKLVYEQTVHVDLSNNAINLADSAIYGHRVVVTVPKTDLNDATQWIRAADSLYPVGSLKQPDFTNLLLTRLGAVNYIDLDGQANGLSFSSASLNSSVDTRLRKNPTQNTVNDWVMAYVLYKLYGKSSVNTINEVYNLQDVHNMLDNVTVTSSIASSLATNQSSVQKLFRDLLVSDPMRFFDSNGHQIEGLFETNPAGSERNGKWLITEYDVIEIRLEFEFMAPITRRNIADSQLTTSGATKDISAGEKFYIRLQVTAI